MIKKIKVEFKAIEMMLYYWQSIAEREKVGEAYILEVGDLAEMSYLYGEDFDKESVRKVLSAISNRELLNNATKKESKYWNNNMWMLEDLENMNNMVKPIKTLNLNYFIEKLNEKDPQYEELEVIFLPGHGDEYIIDDNKLIINFFRLMVDFMDETKVNISGKPFKEYVEEKLIELIS